MRTLLLAAALACIAVPAAADTTAPKPGKGARPGAPPADKSAPPAPTTPYVLATLERTACFGTCPVYRLTVWSDGRVEWDGRRFVKLPDKATARLGAGDLQALRAAFAEARYFDLQGDFACRGMTDQPSINTAYNDGTRSRAIPFYRGCRIAGADALLQLGKRIDEIVNTERWIGTHEERRRMRME